MARGRLLFCICLVLAWATPRVSAQDAADREAIEALRDSLESVRDTVALLALEASTITRARRDRDNPLLHIRLGFVALRLGALTGASARYEDAAGEFEWATELVPGWPYPWYGLGIAELALGEHDVIAIENLRQQLGKDYLSKAAGAFARAARADPSFGRAAVELAQTALVQRIRPRLDVALQAVRMAAAAAGHRPDIQLARGRVEREVGDIDSAGAAFLSYVALGGDSGIGLLELARSEYLAGRPDAGERAYLEGARTGGSAEAVALYRRDLSWVASPEELAAFDSVASAGALAAWLRRFWGRRDRAEVWEPGARLTEHYRRWSYARRNFRLVSRHRRYDITEVYRPDQVEFDDRGVIYIRHGEPDRRSAYSSGGVEPNVSWLYRRPAGDLVFHFVARDDVQDYRLVESLADVLGFGRAVRAQGQVDPVLRDLYASRIEFGPLYHRVAGGGGVLGRILAEERRVGQRSITLGTESDSYERRFDAELALVHGVLVMSAESAGPRPQRLLVVFALPARQLTPTAGPAGVLYPVRFELLVTDSTERPVARLDTTRVFSARAPLPDASFIQGHLDVPVPAGRLRYGLVVATPDGTRGALMRDTLDVMALDGRRFAMSDLVVGRAGGLPWATRGDTVLLNPLGQSPERSLAEVYYELHGLAIGRRYHTVVRLEKLGGGSVFSALGRLFGGGRSPVRLEFDAVAEARVMRVHRAIDLRDTSRGAYRLTVTLSDSETGRTIARSREFQVVRTP